MRSSAVPRLVKKSHPKPFLTPSAIFKPAVRRKSGPVSQPISTLSDDDYTQYRLRRLVVFQRYLLRYERRHPGTLDRQVEILPYFRAMLDGGAIRCRPIKHRHRDWILRYPDRDVATHALYRVVFHQHRKSVDWPIEGH